MPKYQIFISSTFTDLKDERRAVTEQILNMGHIPVGMEIFQASDDDQWTYISNRLRSMDYYAVIIAERYGSIDPKTGMSFTEKEYRLALEHGIPVVAFLLSEDARPTWKTEHAESDRKLEIDAFRELCQQKMTKYWSTTGELALHVSNSLSELFNSKPRPGLVPASEAASSQTLNELSRLSEENHRLAEQLNAFLVGSEEPSEKEKETIAALETVSIDQFWAARGLRALRQTSKATYETMSFPKALSLLELLKMMYCDDSETISAETVFKILVRRANFAPAKWTYVDDGVVHNASHGALQLLATLRQLQLERVHSIWNRGGFPNRLRSDSSSMLETEASMHGATVFSRLA